MVLKIENECWKIEEMQAKNKKYHEQLSKKDFFREYDYMNREVFQRIAQSKNNSFFIQVEGLKVQNKNLEVMLKKVQEKN